MSLTGRRIGPYDLRSLLGAGGMGEVYLARDTRLGRDVAIKILPQVFTADPDRLARFEREARVLASLNHPNIGAIYGLEEADGVRALVLELVEGETLAERIRRPEGLRLPGDGSGGLQASRSTRRSPSRGRSPRRSTPRTRRASSIATSSPPTSRSRPTGRSRCSTSAWRRRRADDGGQSGSHALADDYGGRHARGRDPGDGRLHEPRTGARPGRRQARPTSGRSAACCTRCSPGGPPSAGDTLTDTLAAIVEREPDWAGCLPAISPNIRRLLHHCVDKDPKRRLRDIGDARFEIETALTDGDPPAGIVVPTPRHHARLKRVVAAAGLLAAGVIGGGAVERRVATTIVRPQHRAALCG